MRYSNIVVTLLLFSKIAFSYQDMDIDGVDDSMDRCLDTPFDELVDENGCSKSQTPSKNYGHFTIRVGTDFFTDSEYEDDSSLNLYANYRYNSWDISLSNSRSTSNSNYSDDNSYSDNDVYVSLGKSFNLKKSLIKFSVGTKIVGDVDSDKAQKYTTGRGVGKYGTQSTLDYEDSEFLIDEDRDNDYFASINLNYMLNYRQNISLYYGYTVSGDSETVDYEDYSSFSIGTGYMLTKNWYSALSYNYTGSIYEDGDASENITLFSSYNFTKNIFASIGYSYAIDDLSYDNTFSLALGFNY